MYKFRTTISITLALLACVAGGPSVQAQAQSSYRYFPETQHSVSGKFLAYWDQHGGLAQQGYPITQEMQETSDINGKVYIVQYFERAVFELHPENQPPYDVLLSLLGRMRYEAKYPQGAPDQKPNESAGSVYFPQTGKRLGGSFLAYWKQFGGLMQQGYPISDEIQEKSDLNGITYTVQYFERSVMEWHPGNTPPYDVLLSLLGTFRWDEKYGSPSHPAKFVSSQVIRQPIAAGDYLFWISAQPNESVYGYNIPQNRQFLITFQGGAYALASDGKTVAWTQETSIRGYDLSTGQEFPILDVSPPRALGNDPRVGIALNNGVLYYSDIIQTGNWQEGSIYSYNLATKVQTKLVEHGLLPVVKDGVLLWSHESDLSVPPEIQLHALKLDGSMGDTLISSGLYHTSGYDVAGDNIVWAGHSTEAKDSKVYLYYIRTGQRKELSGPGAFSPFISGNKVLWTETGGVPTDWSIKLYDIATDTLSLVTKVRAEYANAVGITRQGSIAYITGVMGDIYRELYIID